MKYPGIKMLTISFLLLVIISSTATGINIWNYMEKMKQQAEEPENTNEKKQRKIQICLLLDTSSSMNGLIEQAKSQLWNIVNELTKAKCEEGDPSLEIALYEYGNDGLTQSSAYIRQLSPLITDLDKISIKLFELTTNGGQEYCGTVIHKASKELEWSDSEKDIKMIFIAGNEPFTQGSISYEKACGNARGKDIIINTIHCGTYEVGVSGKWKSGALIGGGDYMSIEQDRRTIYVQTPYDDRINELSTGLNDTYIYYGSKGKGKKMEQEVADEQAKSYSKSNLARRNSVKASSYYNNATWDLVDASVKKDFDIKSIDKSTLPSKLQDKSDKELLVYIQQQKNKRERVKKEITQLNVKRDIYIRDNQTDQGESVETSMVKALRKQAELKNYTW